MENADPKPDSISPLRVVTFFDGQNLFKALEERFERKFPDFDVIKLSKKICEKITEKRQAMTVLSGVQFYSGVPPAYKDLDWSYFWAEKMRSMKRTSEKIEVQTIARDLRYSKNSIEVDGAVKTIETKREKGIDVRIALDIVRLASLKKMDVCVIFSQDNDLSEVVEELNLLKTMGVVDEHLSIYSSYPVLPLSENVGEPEWNHRGIKDTMWLPFTKEEYSGCIDSRSFTRPPKRKAQARIRW